MTNKKMNMNNRQVLQGRKEETGERRRRERGGANHGGTREREGVEGERDFRDERRKGEEKEER